MKNSNHKITNTIRSENRAKVINNPWGFSGSISQKHDVAHLLNETNGVESCHLDTDFAADCGCLNTKLGGVCFDCVEKGSRGLICIDCFSHCVCGRPVCNGHSVHINVGEYTILRLCKPCFKRQLWRLRICEILSWFLP